MRRRHLVALAAAGSFTGLATAQAARSFDLQGHRGARALAPENTLESFAVALELGVTTLELDTAITSDGVVVVSHDPTLNPDITRGPDGKFLDSRGPAIASLTYEELQRYDVGRIKPGTDYARQFADQRPSDGARIPRLQEVFELVRRSGNTQVRFAIETKVSPVAPQHTLAPEPYTKAVLKAIQDGGMAARSSVLSFDWRTLQLVQRDAPAIPTVYLSIQPPARSDNIGAQQGSSPWTAGLRHADHGSVPRMIKAAGGHTWSAWHGNLDAGKVKEAQGLGLQVLGWTVNDAAGMDRLMDLGVDGIVTDRPDLLRERMQQRGIALPAPTPAVRAAIQVR